MPKSRSPDVHLNLNVRGMMPSATVAINERCNALRAEGREVFKLGLGQSPFPVPEVVVRELQNFAHEKDYLPVKGLPALRHAVAEYHRLHESVGISAEDVLVGPGSKELMFLVQLVYYGDLVIPTPSWVSYAPQAEIIGRKVRWVPTHASEHWQMTPDGLAELCAEDARRPRIVVLNYPNNPTGGTYKLDELKALARVARQHQVVLLSDEIYGQLHFKGQHVSIARFYPEGTIISGGLSKWCGAGGWRLGYFAFPRSLRWLLDAMAAAASETYTSTSAPIQYAAVRAYKGGLELERYLRNARRLLSALGRFCTTELNAAKIRVDPPRGAFYVFPDFGDLHEPLAARGISTSEELCERLLEDTGVALLPGTAFGRPPEELTARLAYVDFDGAAALASVEALPADSAISPELLRANCAGVMTAVERICDWVAQDA